MAKHKSGKLQEHGKDESLILSALSKEKQDQLKSLLEKLQKQWLEDHKKHHQKIQTK